MNALGSDHPCCRVIQGKAACVLDISNDASSAKRLLSSIWKDSARPRRSGNLPTVVGRCHPANHCRLQTPTGRAHQRGRLPSFSRKNNGVIDSSRPTALPWLKSSRDNGMGEYVRRSGRRHGDQYSTRLASFPGFCSPVSSDVRDFSEAELTKWENTQSSVPSMRPSALLFMLIDLGFQVVGPA